MSQVMAEGQTNVTCRCVLSCSPSLSHPLPLCSLSFFLCSLSRHHEKVQHTPTPSLKERESARERVRERVGERDRESEGRRVRERE